MKKLFVPYKEWKIIENEDIYQRLYANTVLSNFTLDEIIDLTERYSNGDNYKYIKLGRLWWTIGCYYRDGGKEIIIDREFITEYDSDELILSPKGNMLISNNDKFAEFVNKALQEKLNKDSSNEDEGREI